MDDRRPGVYWYFQVPSRFDSRSKNDNTCTAEHSATGPPYSCEYCSEAASVGELREDCERRAIITVNRSTSGSTNTIDVTMVFLN